MSAWRLCMMGKVCDSLCAELRGFVVNKVVVLTFCYILCIQGQNLSRHWFCPLQLIPHQSHSTGGTAQEWSLNTTSCALGVDNFSTGQYWGHREHGH